mmetsp:Transcript_54708/g.160916  ORF Transcript_54708/g.160916 Transcript_54708/m.160916 type:complete len:331 (-) Transcript_54708:97-1089(-)
MGIVFLSMPTSRYGSLRYVAISRVVSSGSISWRLRCDFSRATLLLGALQDPVLIVELPLICLSRRRRSVSRSSRGSSVVTVKLLKDFEALSLCLEVLEDTDLSTVDLLDSRLPANVSFSLEALEDAVLSTFELLGSRLPADVSFCLEALEDVICLAASRGSSVEALVNRLWEDTLCLAALSSFFLSLYHIGAVSSSVPESGDSRPLAAPELPESARLHPPFGCRCWLALMERSLSQSFLCCFRVLQTLQSHRAGCGFMRCECPSVDGTSGSLPRLALASTGGRHPSSGRAALLDRLESSLAVVDPVDRMLSRCSASCDVLGIVVSMAVVN